MRRYTSLALFLLLAVVLPALAQCDCEGPVPHSCGLLKGQRAIFVGLLIQKEPRLRFRVDENIKGVNTSYFEIEDIACMGYEGFQVGRQYLVFVVAMRLDDGEHLFAQNCGPTQEVKYAEATLEQLRAEKQGKREAAVYGTLLRTCDGDCGESYIRPLPEVVIKLQSKKKSFKTTTDEDGAYAFERLPSGIYQVSTEGLPANLQIGQHILKGPVPPFELPRRECFENDITAFPTGRISGEVIGPDGVPLVSTSVGLYRARRYKEGEPAEYAYQGDAKPFDFERLPSGDYLLVFNAMDQANPDTPFPRTFYPDAPDLRSARSIHLKDGQQILNADIHIRETAFVIRAISVQLLWGDKNSQNYGPVDIIAKASKGVNPYPQKITQNTYGLNLLSDATYTVYAEAYCKTGTGRVTSDAILVNGTDTSISEVSLTFHGSPCSKK